MIMYSKPNLIIIKALAKEKKYTLKDLSQKIGMSERGLHNAIRNNNISLQYLVKIANELQTNINTFFNIEFLWNKK